MPSKSSMICPAPSHSIVITSDGFMAPCCIYPLKNHSFKDLNIKEKKSDDLYKTFSHLSKTMDQGGIPLECKVCFKKESEGLISRRLSILKNFKKNHNPETYKRFHAEISFSNHCNLNCAMCNAHFSDKWTQTHKLFSNSKSDSLKKYHKDFIQTTHSHFIPKEEVVSLAKLLDGVQFIELLGGEPLLYPHLDTFLSTLSRNPSPPELVLPTTNLTVLNKKIINTLKDSKLRFTFTISLDGTNETYDYIRGFPFKKVNENIDALLSQDFTQSVFINPTFGFLNSLEYPNLFNWIEGKKSKRKIKVKAQQFLRAEEPTSFIALPENIRDEHIEILKKFSLPPDNQKELQTVIHHIQAFPKGSKENFKEAFEFIQVFNQHRKLDILEINPSLKYLTQYS